MTAREVWSRFETELLFPLFLISFVPGPQIKFLAMLVMILIWQYRTCLAISNIASQSTNPHNGWLPMKGWCIHNPKSYSIITSYNISSWPHVLYHIHMNLIFQLVELASILIVFTVMFFLSLSLCWYDFPRTLWFFLTWIDFNFNLTFQTRNKHINSGLVCWLRADLQCS